jgi:hypothetical protein
MPEWGANQLSVNDSYYQFCYLDRVRMSSSFRIT